MNGARPNSHDGDANESGGLLERIALTALDDDYYMVRAGEPQKPRRFNTPLTAAALGLFALMVTVAAIQTATNRPATEREQRALAQDVALRRSITADRRDSVADLRSDVRDLSAAAGREAPESETLRTNTATIAVHGPGIRISIAPAANDGGRGDVSDSDLQALVNALWFFGAEAIAVNEQRVGTLTSIRTAGEAITVNIVSISPPYTIQAIGDVDTLRDRFESSRLGQDWERRASSTDLEFSIAATTDQRLDAIGEDRQKVVHAKPAEDDS